MSDPLFEEDDAFTPLTAEEREGLIPSQITLRRELNEASFNEFLLPTKPQKQSEAGPLVRCYTAHPASSSDQRTAAAAASATPMESMTE